MKQHFLAVHTDPYPEAPKIERKAISPIEMAASQAAGDLAKWWGPILRPWAPEPYGEINLRRWFPKHWQQHPQASPIAEEK